MKYAVVTGAYGGMGKATVDALREQGYYVFALDLKVGEAQEGVEPIAIDVTDQASVERAVAQVRARTERVDAVVHFAGIYMLDSLVEIGEEEFVRVFDVNVFGVYRINRALMPVLGKGSRIIITTSELAPLQPLPFTGLYAITKATLDRYAYSLRMEVQLLGIEVVVLRPGAVDTGMLGVSTRALDRFCERSKLYACNAARFKRIVERVEAHNVPASKVARKVAKILRKRKPALVYKLNRNPLLLLLNVLPKRTQTAVIRAVLKDKK